MAFKLFEHEAYISLNDALDFCNLFVSLPFIF